MISFFQDKKSCPVCKCLYGIIAAAFMVSVVVPPSPGLAQTVFDLPAAGTILSPTAGYAPPLLTGMTIHPDNPLQFDFIITRGDDQLDGAAFEDESKKLINYFLAALTVPDDEMWVNLSPYEQDRIIADGLSVTEMGRDMLIQDYLLKQFTASLMYPEEELGHAFWQRIYEKVRARFGDVEIPTNTFNKVWIVPRRAAVYVNGTHVFVSDSYLKVMLEEDYLAQDVNRDSTAHGLGNVTQDDLDVIDDEAKAVIREVILPEIEREVNHGKTFANLRQIYHAMILAAWYKQNLRESVLGRVYMDQNKVNGIDLALREAKAKIYQQYVEAFKRGVYDYIKEDYDSASGAVIPRRYFSGGLASAGVVGHTDGAGLQDVNRGAQQVATAIVPRTDAASLSKQSEEVIAFMMTQEEHRLEDLKAEAQRLGVDLSAFLDFIRELGDHKEFRLDDGRWTTFLEVLDEQGHPTGTIKSYWANWRLDEWRDIVGVLVFDSQGRLVTQLRGDQRQWDTSAAGQRDLNLSVFEGTKKELKEELGLEFSDDRFVALDRVFRMRFFPDMPEEGGVVESATGNQIFQMKSYYDPIAAITHLYSLYLTREESDRLYATFRSNEEVARIKSFTPQELGQRFQEDQVRGIDSKQIQQGLTALLGSPGFLEDLERMSNEVKERGDQTKGSDAAKMSMLSDMRVEAQEQVVLTLSDQDRQRLARNGIGANEAWEPGEVQAALGRIKETLNAAVADKGIKFATIPEIQPDYLLDTMLMRMIWQANKRIVLLVGSAQQKTYSIKLGKSLNKILKLIDEELAYLDGRGKAPGHGFGLALDNGFQVAMGGHRFVLEEFLEAVRDLRRMMTEGLFPVQMAREDLKNPAIEFLLDLAAQRPEESLVSTDADALGGRGWVFMEGAADAAFSRSLDAAEHDAMTVARDELVRQLKGHQQRLEAEHGISFPDYHAPASVAFDGIVRDKAPARFPEKIKSVPVWTILETNEWESALVAKLVQDFMEFLELQKGRVPGRRPPGVIKYMADMLELIEGLNEIEQWVPGKFSDYLVAQNKAIRNSPSGIRETELVLMEQIIEDLAAAAAAERSEWKPIIIDRLIPHLIKFVKVDRGRVEQGQEVAFTGIRKAKSIAQKQQGGYTQRIVAPGALSDLKELRGFRRAGRRVRGNPNERRLSVSIGGKKAPDRNVYAGPAVIDPETGRLVSDPEFDLDRYLEGYAYSRDMAANIDAIEARVQQEIAQSQNDVDQKRDERIAKTINIPLSHSEVVRGLAGKAIAVVNRVLGDPSKAQHMRLQDLHATIATIALFDAQDPAGDSLTASRDDVSAILPELDMEDFEIEIFGVAFLPGYGVVLKLNTVAPQVKKIRGLIDERIRPPKGQRLLIPDILHASVTTVLNATADQIREINAGFQELNAELQAARKSGRRHGTARARQINVSVHRARIVDEKDRAGIELKSSQGGAEEQDGGTPNIVDGAMLAEIQVKEGDAVHLDLSAKDLKRLVRKGIVLDSDQDPQDVLAALDGIERTFRLVLPPEGALSGYARPIDMLQTGKPLEALLMQVIANVPELGIQQRENGYSISYKKAGEIYRAIEQARAYLNGQSKEPGQGFGLKMGSKPRAMIDGKGYRIGAVVKTLNGTLSYFQQPGTVHLLGRADPLVVYFLNQAVELRAGVTKDDLGGWVVSEDAVQSPYVQDLIDNRDRLQSIQNQLSTDHAEGEGSPGGIDFNPGMMDFRAQGQTLEFELDNSLLETLTPESVQGVTSQIMSITPIHNMAPLLGLADDGQEVTAREEDQDAPRPREVAVEPVREEYFLKAEAWEA